MYPLTDKLANIQIGSQLDARVLNHRSDRSDWLVLNVSDVSNNPHADVCMPLVYPIYDSDGAFRKIEIPVIRLTAVATVILEMAHKGKRLMVHCHAGLERSPLAVAWYLAFYHMRSLDEAYKAVRAIRPEALDCRAWIKYDDYYQYLRCTGR